jgi:hypothetical protein
MKTKQERKEMTMNTKPLFYLVLAVLLLSACSGQQNQASAQAPAVSPDQVVSDFYDWYLDRSVGGIRDIHESVHLTGDLISRYDEAMQSGGPGGGISLVCAQDFPDEIVINSTEISGSSASVIAHTSFGSTLELTLKIDGGDWKIDNVQCK